LTKQHGEKITEANRLLNMTPEQLLDADPQVNYIFVRLYQLFQSSPDGFTPTPVDELRKVNAPLFSDLVFRSDLPKRFELLAELRVEDDRDFAFIRVFRIQR
jgi:methionyl-tRNA synthetase